MTYDNLTNFSFNTYMTLLLTYDNLTNFSLNTYMTLLPSCQSVICRFFWRFSSLKSIQIYMASSSLYFCPYIYCSCYKGRLRPFLNFFSKSDFIFIIYLKSQNPIWIWIFKNIENLVVVRFNINFLKFPFPFNWSFWT